MKSCAVCSHPFPPESLFPLEMVKSTVFKHIERDHPQVDRHSFICEKDLRRYRTLRDEEILRDSHPQLQASERAVLKALGEKLLIASQAQKEEQPSLGEWLSDRLTLLAGSWGFISVFFLLLVIWMFVNSYLMIYNPFDPYPYILLNLLLSCLAAIQAPIILMSQNRQNDTDRKRADIDYQTDLKAELEIRAINSKIDHLMKLMWEHNSFEKKAS